MKLTKLATEEDRRMKIVEYISSHQGCNIQDVIRGVGDYVSRVTVFKILESLEKSGIVTRQKGKPNSRDHKLFVDSNNPLISLPIEFDKFKRYYYPLLKRVRKAAKKYPASSNRSTTETYRYFARLTGLGSIFGGFIRIYVTRALLAWPKQTRDPETLKNLYMLLFSKVLEIRDEINKVFQSLFSDLGALAEEGIVANIGVGLLEGVRRTIIEQTHPFENTPMQTVAYGVLDHVCEIWEEDYYSYESKAKSLERKMGQQFGNSPSNGK